MTDTFNYERNEIWRALSRHREDDGPLQVKIRGSKDESRWLNATPAQVRAIADILGGN